MSEIYNGSFVLGDTSATTIIAGDGIKVDSSVPGTIRISNDETVLWSGTTASNNNDNFGGSWSIAEPLSAFENVDIYHWEQYACPDSARKSFEISRVPVMNNSFFLQIGPFPENTGIANWFNMKVYGDDKQVRISGGFNAFQNQNILLFNSTNMWSHGQVYKIVGINRLPNT